MRRALIPTLLSAALAAGPAAAFDIAKMSENEREQFRAEVRAYLLDHPEVLMEAIQELEKQRDTQQAQADSLTIRQYASAIFDDGVSWIGGNPKGDVTVVEFLDYKCGYCKKSQPEVTQLLTDDGNIRYIVKEFPILGDQSILASRFAITVKRLAGDDAYAKIHDQLMAFRGEISDDRLKSFATENGLDAEAIMAGMADPETDAVIAANHKLAGILQINGTPGFVIGNQLVRGYIPLDQMAALVKDTRG